MDANEIARQRGAQLHVEAVALGHDPWGTYKFACAEADRRGFGGKVVDREVLAAAGGSVQVGGRSRRPGSARSKRFPKDRF